MGESEERISRDTSFFFAHSIITEVAQRETEHNLAAAFAVFFAYAN